jgi:deoxyribodipyrimidine photo-lyase
MSVPASRLTLANAAPLRPGGDYVLYWMTAARRSAHSYALDRAIDRARELGKPLLVLEALRCGYTWASDRLHAFVLAGMRDNAARFAAAGVAYHLYVEPAPGRGKGLLAALAARACLIVTDDHPGFFLPRMQAAAAALPVCIERVDGNGLLPLRAAEIVFPTAIAFRRFIQKRCRTHFEEHPRVDPLARLSLPRVAVPADILARWPAADEALLQARPAALAALPIDHAVAPCGEGGSVAATRTLARFIDHGLPRYEERNDPAAAVTSGLSPYLHFGHIGAHEVFAALMRREGWRPDRLARTTSGSREGWWGVGAAAEGFLDQLVTWRELGFNMCFHRPDHESYESLPRWAQQTLDEHAGDRREHLYSAEQLESAQTHDALWNAAQRQLLRDGTIHNYLRMLWGKKVLEWSPDPRTALATLTHLNNKYALDGRDPNSSSGIAWTLGRYDRAWGPERPVFGKIRYMSSDNTARKLHVAAYLRQYAPEPLFEARLRRGA